MTTSNWPNQIILYNDALGTADNFVGLVDLGKIRIKRLWAIADQAQAVHATIVREVKLGTPADDDRYGYLTNDSDLVSSLPSAPSGVIVSSAWAAKTTKELDYSTKTVGNAPDVVAPGTPGGSFPEHSGPLQLTVVHAGTTPTACRFTVGMDYYPSD